MAMTTEEMINASQCFGVAFDPTVSECKQCDVHLRCEQKCRMGRTTMPTRPMSTMLAGPMDVLEPATTSQQPKSTPTSKPKTSTSAQPSTPIKKTVKDAVKSKNYDPAMPEFKGLTLQQMEKMVVERGGDLADFEKYKAENIRRMRLTMYLKKTYEI